MKGMRAPWDGNSARFQKESPDRTYRSENGGPDRDKGRSPAGTGRDVTGLGPLRKIVRTLDATVDGKSRLLEAFKRMADGIA